MIILTVVVFLFILGFIVFLHELGHFLVARKSGVLVEEFGIGMPPRAVGFQKIDNKWRVLWGNKSPEDIRYTVYSLNWLPLGGFVKLYGDGAGGEGGEVLPQLADKAFENKNVWARAAIMVAGVVMNILLAAAIFYFLLGKNGFVSDRVPLIGSPNLPFGKTETSVAAINVLKESPADKAGIKKEDIILRVRTVGSTEWKVVTKPNDLIDEVKKNDGKKVEVELKNYSSGAMRNVVVTPKYDKKEKRAMIGVSLANLVRFRYETPFEKALSGFMHSYNLTTYNLQLLGSLFSYAIESKQPQIVGDAVSGPVAIGSVVGDTLKKSGDKVIDNLLNLAALISLSLAFMNILPIPALDGGRLFLLLPEMIIRKRVPKTVEKYINIVGFFVLIGLSIAITIKDIIRQF
ncbi:MAG: M50 family metallopeptidase [Patescibacteria group bacterium]